MKLYFAPMTCSLSPHIVLKELGVDFKLVRINNKTKITEDGDDFLKINPKGYIAALELDDGEVITEGPAILTYIIEKFNWKTINNSKICNIRLLEWLCFISSELHGGSAPLFNDLIPDEVKNIFKEKLYKRYDYLSDILSKTGYLMDDFSPADCYLYAVLLWLPNFNIDISRWPVLDAFMKNMFNKKSVQQAIEAERNTKEC